MIALHEARRDDGFGLTELIIAMTILIVGILAVTGMLVSGMVHIRRASHATTAGALASKEMERLRGISWNTIGLDEADIATTDTLYRSNAAFVSTAANRVALPSCATSPAPCTVLTPIRQAVTGADGRDYRVETFVNWRSVAGGRRVKEATIVVRDGADTSRVWATISSSFDGRDPDASGSTTSPSGNIGPIIAPIGNMYSPTNQTATLNLDASDANGDTLTWTVSGLPPGVTFDESLERISGTPTAAGDYTISVGVSDGDATDATSFLWRVVDISSFPVNLSQGRPTTMSSTWDGTYGSNNAVDGDVSGDATTGTVAISDWQDEPWWEVDLGEFVQIGQIEIYNRTDCCSSYLNNFYVIASPTPFVGTTLDDDLNHHGAKWFHVSGTLGAVGTINFNESGRYVRVRLAETDTRVQLGEVQIFANAGY